jgi:hypothetical protein
MEFIIVESETFPIGAELLTAYNKHVKLNKISSVDKSGLAGKKPEETVVFLPAELIADPDLLTVLEPFQTLGHVLWIDGADGNLSAINSKDLANDFIIKIFAQVFAETRSVGIKCFLEKGSRIYSESIFDTGVLGAKLDPCHKLARKRLGAATGLKVWASVESVILAAFQHLPGNGDGTTGERVDLQIGSDENVFAIGIRFEQTKESLDELLSHPALIITRDQCHFLEVREIRSAKKIEINMAFFRSATTSAVRVIHRVENVALEKADDTAAYGFKPIASMDQEGETAPVTKIKGGFKKKFSEQVKVISGDKNVLDETVIKGDAAEAQKKTVVKGALNVTDSKLRELLQPIVINGPKDKTAMFLESKIIGLQEALREREGVVQRLSREIEEIKDPMKMDIISNIKDNQKQGLQDRLNLMKRELDEASKREKEFMALADKAVVMRDEAMKKIKELELKSRQASGGNNSKVVMLERQLDEATRQRAEMSKRISELMDQIRNKAA